jgi:aspartate carbamoyltransferase catalytic subunit
LLIELSEGVHIINAGDGTNEHPSQALLDIMTILERKPSLGSLKIVIVGNIKHSRVANSLQRMLAELKPAELIMVAPTIWQPSAVDFGRVTSSLSDGLEGADVIICLRVQRERLAADENIDLASYRRNFALTKTTLAYAKKDAMLMHPGPVNRGVEIDSDVADGLQSHILQQVTNGVFMRMAILESLAKTIEKIGL